MSSNQVPRKSDAKIFAEALGTKFFILAAVSFIAAFGLIAIEYFFALFLQGTLKFLSASSLEIKSGWIDIDSFSFNGILIGLIALGFFRFLVTFIGTQSQYFALEAINVRLKRFVLFDMLFKKTSSNIDSTEIFHRFSEVIPKSAIAISSINQILSLLIQMAFLAFILFTSAFYEALISFGGLVFIGLFVIWMSRSIKPFSVMVNDTSKVLSVKMFRAARNLLFFDVMRTNRYEYAQLNIVVGAISQYVLRSTSLNSLIFGFTPVLGLLLLSVVMWISTQYFKTSGIELVAFLYLFMRFVQNLSNLSSSLSTFQNYHFQLEQSKTYIISFFRAPDLAEPIGHTELSFIGSAQDYREEEKKSWQMVGESNIAARPPPSIRIENLSHVYPGASHPTFANLNMDLASGGQVGIFGVSGSGKSTLLQLMMGLGTPKDGTILLDGQQPREFFSNEANRIGYVGAEPYLIKGTLLENLSYGVRRSLSEEEILSAIDRAHLTDFVKRVGLQYRIQEDHSGLSAGQKQRICLARALLNRPNVLILDEATANLDDRTEDMILESIRELKGKCTVVVVSHRKNFIRYADAYLDLSPKT